DKDIVFESNHFTTITPAKLIVKVKKCGIEVRDTIDIAIIPNLVTGISAPDTVCSGDTTILTATAGAGTYHWDFGDDSTASTFTNSTTHVWWNATGTYQTVTVEVTPDGAAFMHCPPIGTGTKNIVIKPGPAVGISTTDPLIYY